MNEDGQLILKLIEELILAWGINFTSGDISFESDKVKLLTDVRDWLNKRNIEPTPVVRDYYQEVFLRDQFGGTTRRGK